jgi:hypothetical protein
MPTAQALAPLCWCAAHMLQVLILTEGASAAAKEASAAAAAAAEAGLDKDKQYLRLKKASRKCATVCEPRQAQNGKCNRACSV